MPEPLPLSQAILLGATLAPQAFGMLVDDDGHTCANGAAFEAAGLMTVDRTRRPVVFTFTDFWFLTAVRLWPVLNHKAACPACPNRIDQVSGLIVHLNNDHRWTRPRIADFVAAIETQLDPPVLTPAAVQTAALALQESDLEELAQTFA